MGAGGPLARWVAAMAARLCRQAKIGPARRYARRGKVVSQACALLLRVRLQLGAAARS